MIMNSSQSSLNNISEHSEQLYESVKDVSGMTTPRANSDLSDLSRLIDAAKNKPKSFELPEIRDGKGEVKPNRTQVERVEPIDDFIRNFFIKNQLTRSLAVFQQEYYELKIKQKNQGRITDQLPDLYLQNQHLEQQVLDLQKEVDSAKLFVNKTKETFEKLRKDRDYNKLHYSRVQQEKEKILKELEKLKGLQLHQEQRFQEIGCKYENCMKDKMLIKLEKDRLAAKNETFEKTIESLEKKIQDYENRGNLNAVGGNSYRCASMNFNTGRGDGNDDKENVTKLSGANVNTKSHAGAASEKSGTAGGRKQKDNPQFTPIPQPLLNPYIDSEIEPRLKHSMVSLKSMKGHMSSISKCKIHPKKPFLATASDDKTWKVWSLPKGELLMSGEGHTDWISDVAFHPKGTHLATSSGDCVIKVWDLMQVSCAMTFREHSQPIWSIDFNFSGDFLVAGAVDHCCRMYDINYGKLRYTFRGHVDSVNNVKFSRYNNTFMSASTDKTLSMWDIRTGLLCNTLYGHTSGINSIALSADENRMVSVDTEGVVKCWDLRKWKLENEIDCGPHPANGVDLDPSGKFGFVASDDGNVKIIDLDNFKVEGELRGHEDAVLDVVTDIINKEIVTCSADTTFRTWG